MTHGTQTELIRLIALFGGVLGIASAIYFHIFVDQYIPGEYTLSMALMGLGLIALGTTPSVGHAAAGFLRIFAYLVLLMIELIIIFSAWVKSHDMPKEADLLRPHER